MGVFWGSLRKSHFLDLSKMFRNFPLVISRAENKENDILNTNKDQFMCCCWQQGGKGGGLSQHFNGAWNTCELFINAKHVFNICSVTLGGNLYQHLLIEENINRNVSTEEFRLIAASRWRSGGTDERASVKFSQITDTKCRYEPQLWTHKPTFKHGCQFEINLSIHTSFHTYTHTHIYER